MNFRAVEIQATFVLEIITRAFLSVVFLELEQTTPFVRKIHPDELWLYKNPRTPSYVPTNLLWPLVFIVPTAALLLYYVIRRDKTDLTQGILSLSLALGLNGVITNIIKIIVGRPRPDFFFRCFPDGKVELDEVKDIAEACTGQIDAIEEGRKSFPSGHSSFSFCSLGFMSLWLYGKLGVFSRRRGEGWRFVVGSIPIITALMVALSRTCDYHHHWQDVLVGSLIGLVVSYLCYRQYYPRLTSPYSHMPYLSLPGAQGTPLHLNLNGQGLGGRLPIDPESPFEEQVKWI
ncbi:phospholipid phosphatase 5 [Oratosquilla oratoria]|uniref:phospholipid phosphatase 5 n=1 Tax=Oratosquilla oratoria TaxID=337810 RepID=UPI003F76AB2D